jgi:hypothetical protein
MFPAEWGRARDPGCPADSCDPQRVDVCPAHRHRHCLARPARSCSVRCSGLRVQAPAGEPHEQPIAPSAVLHPATDPTIHIPLFQSLYITASASASLPALAPALVTNATLSSFCHCCALVCSRPATQPPAHRALALASLPRYVALPPRGKHHQATHARSGHS